MSRGDEAPSFEIVVDGRPVTAHPGDSVAAALWNAGISRLRTSPGGEPRSWLCAMGSCFECQVSIDGRPQRACITPCVEGMTVTLADDQGAEPTDG